MGHIQYISDEQNNITGVIVPIELWREIESEKETASLLKSKKMKKRLLEPKTVRRASPLTKHAKNLEFDPADTIIKMNEAAFLSKWPLLSC